MKKLIALGIFVLGLLMTGCSDKPVLPAELPAQITAFIQQNFPGQAITFAKKDLELTGWQYDVVLADGTQIDFDTDDMWDMIQSPMTNPVPVNLIPAVGFGFNLINFHFASNFDLENDDGSYTGLRDRYYSTIASTFNSELELRLEISQFAIGVYGGYRAVRYNELNVEGNNLETAFGKYDTDNVGDTWFVGLRLTWIFLSDWQEKQNDKL